MILLPVYMLAVDDVPASSSWLMYHCHFPPSRLLFRQETCDSFLKSLHPKICILVLITSAEATTNLSIVHIQLLAPWRAIERLVRHKVPIHIELRKFALNVVVP